MQVFRVKFDWDNFQTLHVADPDLFSRTVSSHGFDGQPRRQRWPRLECFVADPTLPAGDFFGFSLGVVGVTSRALAALQDLFDATGELLPIFLEDQVLHLFHPTRFAEGCLDREGSKYHLLGGKFRAGIETFSFIADYLRSESIFRVSEEPGVLAVSGQVDPILDFRRRVLDCQLTGLTFQLLWQEGGPPIRSWKP